MLPAGLVARGTSWFIYKHTTKYAILVAAAAAVVVVL